MRLMALSTFSRFTLERISKNIPAKPLQRLEKPTGLCEHSLLFKQTRVEVAFKPGRYERLVGFDPHHHFMSKANEDSKSNSSQTKNNIPFLVKAAGIA